MRRCFLIFACLVAAMPAFAANTYYISQSLGDDTRTSATAQSKLTPWKHFPGMHGATSNAAAYSPQPGDQFILRGGDTWLASDLGVDTGLWSGSGSSGSPIYIGVDKTWFTGGSWTRPVFDCQTGICGTYTQQPVWLARNWTIFDNVEIINYQQSSNQTLVAVFGNDNEVENVYIHAFSRTGGSSGNNSFCFTNNSSSGGARRTKLHDNVCDGSDSPNQDFMGGILHGDQVYNNVIRYTYNGMNGTFNDIHGNLVENNYVSTSGDHCNMIFPQNVFTGSTLLVYNNVIRHAGCAGGSTLFTMGNSSCTTCTAYVFNNVLYDNEASFNPKGIEIGSHTATGLYYVYNNTIVTSTGSCIGNGDPGASSTVHYGNNQCVSPNTFCIGPGTTCVDDGNNLEQTAAQANANATPHFDQYNASETYAYSPVAATNSTVGAGANKTTGATINCTISPALCSDTTYAAYDAVNHVVTFRTVNARGSTWDIGAYQFTAGAAPNVALAPVPFL